MISVAVMAHRKRRRWVPRLVEQFDVDVQVVWDRRNDRWDTGRRSLLAYDPAASHHLVVQDDAVLCRDLYPALLEAVKTVGERPFSLYLGNSQKRHGQVAKAVEMAVRKQRPFVEFPGPRWGVALLLPTSHIDDVVQHGDTLDIPNYDLRIADFYSRAGMKCLYTVPSLVDHRHGGGNPSLVPGRTSQYRHAYRYIGKRSALDIDWTRPYA